MTFCNSFNFKAHNCTTFIAKHILFLLFLYKFPRTMPIKLVLLSLDQLTNYKEANSSPFGNSFLDTNSICAHLAVFRLVDRE